MRRYSDYNFVRSGDECVPAGPEPVPVNVCAGHDPDETYLGSSGYRLIPGNTCDREQGLKKDDKIRKSCSKGSGAFCFLANRSSCVISAT